MLTDKYATKDNMVEQYEKEHVSDKYEYFEKFLNHNQTKF
jgi:hypothetical protein